MESYGARAPQVEGTGSAKALTILGLVRSTGEFLGLRLVTRGRQPCVGFVGEVTSFRLGSCGPYFPCGNGGCIPLSLVCDLWGMDNCGDGSDQASWLPANFRPHSQAIGINLSDVFLAIRLEFGAIRRKTTEVPDYIQKVALASPLLLASLASSGAAAPPAAGPEGWCRGLCFSCTICQTGPGQVAPGGLRPGRPCIERLRLQRTDSGLWCRTDPGSVPTPQGLSDLGQVTNPLRLGLLLWKTGRSLPPRVVGEATGGDRPHSSCGGWHSAGSVKGRTSVPRAGSRGLAHLKLP